MQCAGDDWEKRKSNQQTDSQLMGRKRRAGDRFFPSSYEEEVVRQTEHRWDTPHKHALFGSDEPDNTTSVSDVVETQDFGLPRYSGKSSWGQHRQVFADIACSNGWSPTTVALQLFAHLDGEALNVAFLMPVEERERWTAFARGLSDYFNSPVD